jgi:hypothetical protein
MSSKQPVSGGTEIEMRQTTKKSASKCSPIVMTNRSRFRINSISSPILRYQSILNILIIYLIGLVGKLSPLDTHFTATASNLDRSLVA